MTNTEKLEVNHLQVGMYIAKLDRPWLDTPFPFQGFYLRTTHEISEVQRFCDYVFIDVEKGSQYSTNTRKSKIGKPSPLSTKTKAKLKSNKRIKNKSKYLNASDLKEIVINVGKYENQTTSFKKEINNAKTLFSDLSHSVEQISFNIRVGKKLNIAETKKLTKSVVSSVIKNPNTMIWLSRLKDKGDYTYNHSLRACVLATVFGRYLGLTENELVNLTTGVLLSDIGKTKISRNLLSKSEKLSESEMEIAKSHVELGVEMLATEESIDHTTLVIVETHHERFNGSGYPYGLVGAEIPLFGQIAGLVDVFDAITNKKAYGQHMTPAQAMDWLYNQKNKLFSSSLIQSFIQAIGLYPAGTVVELTDKSIGLVVSHNYAKRLRPVVFMLKDKNKKDSTSNKTIDLSKRAFLSKVDRPMVKGSLLPENLGITGDIIVNKIQAPNKIRKVIFG